MATATAQERLTRVPDAVQIDVTQRCIDSGRPGHGESCAVALAVRSLPSVVGVDVTGTDFVAIEYDGLGHHHFVGTDEVDDFIRKFDSAGSRYTVEPKSFLLRHSMLCNCWEASS